MFSWLNAPPSSGSYHSIFFMKNGGWCAAPVCCWWPMFCYVVPLNKSSGVPAELVEVLFWVRPVHMLHDEDQTSYTSKALACVPATVQNLVWNATNMVDVCLWNVLHPRPYPRSYHRAVWELVRFWLASSNQATLIHEQPGPLETSCLLLSAHGKRRPEIRLCWHSWHAAKAKGTIWFSVFCPDFRELVWNDCFCFLLAGYCDCFVLSLFTQPAPHPWSSKVPRVTVVVHFHPQSWCRRAVMYGWNTHSLVMSFLSGVCLTPLHRVNDPFKQLRETVIY